MASCDDKQKAEWVNRASAWHLIHILEHQYLHRLPRVDLQRLVLRHCRQTLPTDVLVETDQIARLAMAMWLRHCEWLEQISLVCDYLVATRRLVQIRLSGTDRFGRPHRFDATMVSVQRGLCRPIDCCWLHESRIACSANASHPSCGVENCRHDQPVRVPTILEHSIGVDAPAAIEVVLHASGARLELQLDMNGREFVGMGVEDARPRRFWFEPSTDDYGPALLYNRVASVDVCRLVASYMDSGGT